MKKKSLKRALPIIISMTACMGMLSGCGGRQAEYGSGSGGKNSTAEAQTGNGGRRDPLVVNCTLEGNPGSKDGPVNAAFEKLMSEKLNRDIEIHYELIPSSEYSQKASLLFATGDFGDLIGIPFQFDYSKASEEGFLLDIAAYKEYIPQYWKYMEETNAGIASVTDPDGHVYNIKSMGLPRFPSDSGMLPQSLSMYRTDIFEENKIKVPETIDDVYQAAKKLKEIHPDLYPVNTRWNDLRSLFAANHTSPDVYWDGKEYVMGLYEEGYKEAVEFAAKLYAEGLLDPEYITDSDDMLKSKVMSNKNFILLADWFTTPGECTRLSTTGQIFAAALYPNNPKYGSCSWQNVDLVNEIAINGFSGMAVNAETKDPEGLLELLNHCFDDDVIRLLTWGIEGESYHLDEEGNPVFIDEILKAEDPWSAADAYGMRASKNMRPGIELMDDSKAYVALAADDWLYYDGAVHQEPIERSEYYLNLPFPSYPENPYIPPYFNEPVLQFNADMSQENGQIMTAYQTVRDEWQAALVSGSKSMSEWDAYMEAIKNSADIPKLLDHYNQAAAEYYAK